LKEKYQKVQARMRIQHIRARAMIGLLQYCELGCISLIICAVAD